MLRQLLGPILRLNPSPLWHVLARFSVKVQHWKKPFQFFNLQSESPVLKFFNFSIFNPKVQYWNFQFSNFQYESPWLKILQFFNFQFSLFNIFNIFNFSIFGRYTLNWLTMFFDAEYQYITLANIPAHKLATTWYAATRVKTFS